MRISVLLLLSLAILSVTTPADGRPLREKNIIRDYCEHHELHCPCKMIYTADVNGDGLSELIQTQVMFKGKATSFRAYSAGVKKGKKVWSGSVHPDRLWHIVPGYFTYPNRAHLLAITDKGIRAFHYKSKAPKGKLIKGFKYQLPQQPYHWAYHYQNLVVGDFDGNKRDELAVINTKKGTAKFYRKQTGGDFMLTKNLRAANERVLAKGGYFLAGNVYRDLSSPFKPEVQRDDILRVGPGKGTIDIFITRHDGGQKYKYKMQRWSSAGGIKDKKSCFKRSHSSGHWIVQIAKVKPGPYEQIVCHEPFTGQKRVFEVTMKGLKEIKVRFGELQKHKGYLSWLSLNKGHNPNGLHDCIVYHMRLNKKWVSNKGRARDPRIFTYFKAVYNKKKKVWSYKRTHRTTLSKFFTSSWAVWPYKHYLWPPKKKKK
mgnify:CR=1 FL=1